MISICGWILRGDNIVEGTIAGQNIPHSSIVFDLHQATKIQAELLGGNGIATENIRHTNLVSFTCLKSFAFDQRFGRKDANDLVYCIENAPEGVDAPAATFRNARNRKRGAVIETSLAILRGRFAKMARCRSPSSSWVKAMNPSNVKCGRCDRRRLAMFLNSFLRESDRERDAWR